MLLVYYPKCTTCIGVKKELDQTGLTYELRDIKNQNPTYEELKLWWKLSGLELKSFFNASGVLYKELDLKNRLSSMSEEEQLSLLASDGMLVKRPLWVEADRVLVGKKDILNRKK